MGKELFWMAIVKYGKLTTKYGTGIQKLVKISLVILEDLEINFFKESRRIENF